MNGQPCACGCGQSPMVGNLFIHGHTIELHPPFVQTIIDRWEQFTGKKAVKVAGV